MSQAPAALLAGGKDGAAGGRDSAAGGASHSAGAGAGDGLGGGEAAWDVAVIGYGPVGATAANLLARGGLRVAVVEQEADIYDKPRAIGGDHELLRTLQWCGIGAQLESHIEHYRGTDYLGVDGEPIRTFRASPPPFPLGWPPSFFYVQPELERLLRAAAAARANVRVFARHRWRDLQRVDGGYDLRVEDLGTGNSTVLRTRYVFACDGAVSPVRKRLGIALEDLGFDETWAVVDACLRRAGAVPDKNIQYCWPKRPASFVVGPGALRRWELKLLDGEDAGSFDDARIRAALADYVDPEAIEIWRIAVYRFHALIAARWREEGIFLLGDAAHQMPPFLGQGLCTGIRDVANLVWKILLVERGHAPAAILESYQSERAPHTRSIVEMAKSIGLCIGELDPEAAAARDTALRSLLLAGANEERRHRMIPRLTAGLLGTDGQGGPAPGSGELFLQPRVVSPDGRVVLFDDLVELGFVMLTVEAAAQAWLDEADQAFWARIGGVRVHVATTAIAGTGMGVGSGVGAISGVRVLRETEGLLEEYMTSAGYAAVLVRPDRYIFGAARSEQQLKRLVAELRGWLAVGRDAAAAPEMCPSTRSGTAAMSC